MTRIQRVALSVDFKIFCCFFHFFCSKPKIGNNSTMKSFLFRFVKTNKNVKPFLSTFLIKNYSHELWLGLGVVNMERWFFHGNDAIVSTKSPKNAFLKILKTVYNLINMEQTVFGWEEKSELLTSKIRKMF